MTYQYLLLCTLLCLYIGHIGHEQAIHDLCYFQVEKGFMSI